MDYGMNSVSEGIDAMAITRVVIRPVGQNVKPGVTPQVFLSKLVDACESINLTCCVLLSTM